MTDQRPTPRLEPLSASVRRIMQKHGLSEPSARAVAFLAYGESRNG